MTVSPATPADLPAALALLGATSADEVDRRHLLVAHRDAVLVGAVLAESLPGGVAVIGSLTALADDAETEDALTAAALRRVRGAKVVQAFLPPEEAEPARPLERAGFRHVTQVCQMIAPSAATRPQSRSSRRPGARTATPPRISVLPFSDCDAATFHAVLVRAHDEALDCPELHGLLTPDEMVAGYRDAAPDPAGWWLALADDHPAGALILNGDQLAFLGVVPEFRGRGVGRRLLALAMEQAPGLTLIVDVRNTPAIRLYQSVGFDVVGSREVYLHFPDPAAGITGTTGNRS
jgi:mycothiol synthase